MSFFNTSKDFTARCGRSFEIRAKPTPQLLPNLLRLIGAIDMTTTLPSTAFAPTAIPEAIQQTVSQPVIDASEVLDSEIFLIDDEQLVIDTLTHHLKSAGFTSIHGFVSSGEAIDTLRFVRTDVILTDIHMPDVSGSFLTKLIRTFAHLRDVPIMVVTSDHRPETAEAIRRKGADVILCKPVQSDLLIQYVVETLKRSLEENAAKQSADALREREKARTNRNLQNQDARLREICRPKKS
jgi:CheY-like chemotaxis protein